MEQATARQRLHAAQVATLATADAGGRPHAVPVVFALHGDEVWLAVDAKPKSGRPLKRLANIRANPAVSILAHEYADDWTQLWWVRVDGAAEIRDEHAAARTALRAKYPQYAEQPPPGPFIVVTVERLTGWAAAP